MPRAGSAPGPGPAAVARAVPLARATKAKGFVPPPPKVVFCQSLASHARMILSLPFDERGQLPSRNGEPPSGERLPATPAATGGSSDRPSHSRMPALPLPAARIALPLASIALVGTVARSVAGDVVKGRITGQETLVGDQYVDASKNDGHHYTWREPSPTVRAEFRALSGNPSRDLCIAALSTAGNQPPQAAHPRQGDRRADHPVHPGHHPGHASVVREPRPVSPPPVHRRLAHLEGRAHRSPVNGASGRRRPTPGGSRSVTSSFPACAPSW